MLLELPNHREGRGGYQRKSNMVVGKKPIDWVKTHTQCLLTLDRVNHREHISRTEIQKLRQILPKVRSSLHNI